MEVLVMELTVAEPPATASRTATGATPQPGDRR
jgi:hypothetical protein